MEKADAIRDFYKEYFAIMDMSADFYLETVEQVFQLYLLPQGLMKHKGRKIEPRAIKKTFLLTVEGEKDDICAVGQTLAAQDLCSGLRPYMKTHHLQAGVGHYGVFNGKRWETQVYPGAAQPHPVEPVTPSCALRAPIRRFAQPRVEPGGFAPLLPGLDP